MQAAKRSILLYDAPGIKYDGAVKSAVKKYIPGTTPYSTVNVLCGELLVEYQDNQSFNFQLHRDPNVFLYCEIDNVAPLEPKEFHLLEAISLPGDRAKAFRHKIEWGLTLKEGSSVRVTVPGEYLSAPVQARATVHYKGKIGTQSGTFFGVELLERAHREAKLGTSDGTFLDSRYFHCEDGCGLFVTVRWLSKVDESTSSTPPSQYTRSKDKPPSSTLPSQYTRSKDKPPSSTLPSQYTRSKDKPPSSTPPSQYTRSKDKPPSNTLPSQYTRSKDKPPSSTPPSQYTRSKDKPPALNKSASTDSSPSLPSVHVDPSIPPPQFQINQPVMFYDKNNKKLYGVVRWTGRESATRKFDYNVVGIQTDDDIYKSDYDDSIVGLDHYLKGVPRRRILFLPEALVEEIPSVAPGNDPPSQSVSTQATAETLKVSPEELVKEQKEALEQTEKDKIAKEEEDARNAAKAARESITGQAEQYRKLQPESARKGQQVLISYQQEQRHEDPDALSKRQPNDAMLGSASVHCNAEQQGHPSERTHLASWDHLPEHHQRSSLPEHRQRSSLARGVIQQPHPQGHNTAGNTASPTIAHVDGSYNLRVGSLIQLPAVDGTTKYGTIKWIGVVPNVPGEIAGIEMDESIEGCGDGTFQATGQKFFHCAHGKGLYYPLKMLKPDQRYALEVDMDVQQLYLQLKKQNALLDQQNVKLENESKSLRQQNMDLLQAQGELQAQVKRLTDALQDKQGEIQTRVKDLTDAQAEIQSKAQQIADLQQKLDAEDHQFTQIQPSSSKAESWKVPRAEIQRIPKQEIGVGAWGAVYSAKFRGEDVAFKIAHRQIFHESTVDMLKREVTIMSHIQHPNLVRFIAAVWDDAVERKVDTPIIISELMDTNLRAAYRSVDLSNSLISIFCDVAYALHYLHQHRQPIIHRDISAPNVLLKSSSGSYRAKVSDFGSANLVKQSKTAGAGAIVYCAPEMFPHEDITVPPQPQTTKVDVFSYGILLLEVLSKEMPTQEKRYNMLQKIKRQWNMMYELIVHCTKPSPSHRPAMADILCRLNSIPQ